MCGLYYNFNNLRFSNSLKIIDGRFPVQVVVFVSSDFLKRRLLNRLLDHPSTGILLRGIRGAVAEVSAAIVCYLAISIRGAVAEVYPKYICHLAIII